VEEQASAYRGGGGGEFNKGAFCWLIYGNFFNRRNIASKLTRNYSISLKMMNGLFH
jgi:hypothetical protein